MNYGIPYMGSKSRICEKVCSIFPKAQNFYDLFGGGFSITHYMVQNRSKDFESFHFNEIRPGICDLVKKAIDGFYNYDNFKPAWISREDFFKLKETDPYVKLIWSFGNSGSSYIFGEEIEQQKKSLHNAIVFNEFDKYAQDIFGHNGFKEGFSINDKRLYLKNRLRVLGKERCDLERLEQLERLQQLQQLQQLERLQQLQQLEKSKINFYSGSYEKVEIKKDSIVYCDIPYKGTGEYDKNKNFDHKNFFDWAAEVEEPLFISEYNVDDKRFKCIANFEKRSMMSADKSNTLMKVEKVYTNRAGYKKLITARY